MTDGLRVGGDRGPNKDGERQRVNLCIIAKGLTVGFGRGSNMMDRKDTGGQSITGLVWGLLAYLKRNPELKASSLTGYWY